jgi:hypothetical protein
MAESGSLTADSVSLTRSLFTRNISFLEGTVKKTLIKLDTYNVFTNHSEKILKAKLEKLRGYNRIS